MNLRLLIIGLGLLFFQGCFPVNPLSELESKGELDSLVGMTVSEVIEKYGHPEMEEGIDNLISRPPNWTDAQYRQWKKSNPAGTLGYGKYRVNFNHLNEVMSVDVEP